MTNLSLNRSLDSAQHASLIASSFTQQKKLSGLRKFLFSLAYRLYALRITFLKWWACLYLLVFYPSVVRTLLTVRKRGGLNKTGQWLRLKEMVDLIRLYAPESVLEFGSGTSTAMLANICTKRTTSVEESGYWLKFLLDINKDVAANVTLVRADRVIETKQGEAVCYYNIDHTRYYDLVYVDGPVSEPPPERKDLPIKDPRGYMPNVDVELFWENNIFPRIILIDCRRATVRRLIEKGQSHYNIYLKSDFFINAHEPGFKNYFYHTVMIRKTA